MIYLLIVVNHTWVAVYHSTLRVRAKLGSAGHIVCGQVQPKSSLQDKSGYLQREYKNTVMIAAIAGLPAVVRRHKVMQSNGCKGAEQRKHGQNYGSLLLITQSLPLEPNILQAQPSG